MASPSVSIKAIEASAVHQIQSGQVIVDLCSVAKELIENSIDAGATSIEVRFKNQGLDSIEVQDDGGGIAPQNYETLALKHYTSKLSTYADLATLQTFGFRGEALSSLCALSRLSVVTCLREEAPRATRLEFEPSGRLGTTAVVSGHRGTTVLVENLFCGLPVRRRELERNIKREWGKVVGLLNQYACVLTGVRFSVSQQPTKGKRMVLFSTRGNPTVRDNIINVFGVKAMGALIAMDLKLRLVPTTTKKPALQRPDDDGDEAVAAEVLVRGHVSRPAHGEGRQAPDRQMFYVNGRPCGLPQFAKVFNEVYRSYNASQSPFILADIRLDTHLYDVNVSPDKRTILLHDQGQMLDNLRESLVELFEKQEITVPVAQLSAGKQKQTSKQTPFKVPSATTRSETPASDKGASGRRGDDEADEREKSDGDPGPSSSVSRDKQSSSSLISRWAERASAVRESEKPDETPSRGVSRAASETKPDGSDKPPSKSNDAFEEPPIPSLPPPSQPRPNLTPTGSPKRAAPQVATIRIGDDTVTSTIGPPSKRLKPSVASSSVKPNPGKRKSSGKTSSALPSFKGRLTQMFTAASASRARSPADEGSDGEEEEDKEEEEEEEEEEEQEEQEGEEGSLFVSEGDDDGGAESPRGASVESDGEVSGSGEGDGDTDMGLSAEDAVGRRSIDPPAAKGEARGGEEGEEEGEEEEGGDGVGEEVENKEEDVDDGDYVEEESTAGPPTAQKTAGADSLTRPEGAVDGTDEDAQKRSRMLLKGARRKDSTLQLVQQVKADEEKIRERIQVLAAASRDRREGSRRSGSNKRAADSVDGVEEAQEVAEEKLSLKISKTDFGRMRIVGQFNLGFIIAVREAAAAVEGESEDKDDDDDELFIIDQHASDEKYNFERLQASTVVQSQRLVQPKTLELTAIEEEVVMENTSALEANGFDVEVVGQIDDEDGNTSSHEAAPSPPPVGSRVRLLGLPLSRETTFSLADLQELIFLLADNPTSSAATVPRPSRVRKMLAMRACRSSIMIGRALSRGQMERVVRHMGEMEKPWNCPHGRPTMRHLCGLRAHEARAWSEEGSGTDWGAWVKRSGRKR